MRLELEITETVLIRDRERALSVLRHLHALGVRIALDDFSTGYASLSYLQGFPFDTLKVGQTFVAQIARDPQSATIVDSVIGLGHGLGLRVTAEGVKTSEQMKILKRHGCDAVQGYYLGSPALLQVSALSQGGIHGRVEEGVAATTALLGMVKSNIGVLEHAIKRYTR